MKNTSQSHRSDEEINRYFQSAEYQKKLGLTAKLWWEAGVRNRHVFKPKAGIGAWDRKLADLTKKIDSGLMIALLGLRGCGKTQLAVELMRESCHLGKSARYTTAMDIFIDIRDAYKLQKSERSVLLGFERPSLLVIDEAQERGESSWEDRMLTALIDSRYSQRRDTIIISNLKRDDFLSSMGSSIVSRMIETGGVIECDWPSFRR